MLTGGFRDAINNYTDICTEQVSQFFVAYGEIMTIDLDMDATLFSSPAIFRFQAKQGKFSLHILRYEFWVGVFRPFFLLT